MTTNNIKEKALAKAAELLDNAGHWHSAGGALSASQAVATLVGISEIQESGPSKKTAGTNKDKE